MTKSTHRPIGNHVEGQSQVDERLRHAILDEKESQIKDLSQKIEVLQQTLQSMSFELRVESDQRMLELTNARLTSKILATAMSDPPIQAVIDFSAVFNEAYASHQTPAGLVETLMPDVSTSSWLLITSDSLVGATESTTLTLVLERAIPHGVAIALDVAWQPSSWGLAPGSKPTPEVLRRLHPLAQEATLIRCTPEEADEFFASHDPLTIHRSLSQCPGVVITGIDGSVEWCIGGRIGTMEAGILNEQEHFFASLIKSFAERPELLGNAGEGPGTDAVADPDGLTEALFSGAST
jgi:hypothetical protein